MLVTPWGGYVRPWELESRVLHYGHQLGATFRAWKFHQKWTSMREKEGSEWRLRKKTFAEPEAISAFLDELREAGFSNPRPSGYSYPWNETVRVPRPLPTMLNELRRYPQASKPYAWEEDFPGCDREFARRQRGKPLIGPWRIYDLRSAYAWAACQGMPDPRTTVYNVRCPTGRRHGLYLVRSCRWGVTVVHPHLRDEEWSRGAWVTREELVQLDARELVIETGIEWSRTVDLRPDVDRILSLFRPVTAKRILASFWGSWGARRGPEEFIFKAPTWKSRRLPTLLYNPTWAWLVMARVNLRVQEHARNAAHVYVDSVIVPESITVDAGHLGLGEWRDEGRRESIVVFGAGNWSSERGVEKHAGLTAADAVDRIGRDLPRGRAGAPGMDPPLDGGSIRARGLEAYLRAQQGFADVARPEARGVGRSEFRCPVEGR